MTKSPWTLTRLGFNHYTLTGPSKSHPDLIADIHKSEDAHVIAAAPEILKALKALVNAAEKGGMDCPELSAARIAIDSVMGIDEAEEELMRRNHG